MKRSTAVVIALGLVLAAQSALLAQTGSPAQRGASGDQIEPTRLIDPSKCRIIGQDRTGRTQSALRNRPTTDPVSTSTRLRDRSEQVSRPSEGMLVDPPSGTSAAASQSEPAPNMYCPPEAFGSSK
jgi:hypothetical protein